MKLAIVAYGDPVLKKKGAEISKEYPELDQLIENMFETMYAANGVGLAAPQIGLPIRLFVIDISDSDEPGCENFKKVFINAQILEESGKLWDFNEGCLSIPDVREDVKRLDTVKISYYDEQFNHHEDTFQGLAARVIQHEYDHIEGKLFTDKLSPLKRAMIKSRLDAISRGAVKVGYKMKFPSVSKKR